MEANPSSPCTIVVGTDYSEGCGRALDAAFEHGAGRRRRLHVVNVPAECRDFVRDRIADYIAHISDRAAPERSSGTACQ